jgi:hypothetical protein
VIGVSTLPYSFLAEWWMKNCSSLNWTLNVESWIVQVELKFNLNWKLKPWIEMWIET